MIQAYKGDVKGKSFVESFQNALFNSYLLLSHLEKNSNFWNFL